MTLQRRADRLEAKVEALVDSLRRGGNGHSRRKVVLA